MKKVISIILCLAMLFSSLVLTANAETQDYFATLEFVKDIPGVKPLESSTTEDNSNTNYFEVSVEQYDVTDLWISCNKSWKDTVDYFFDAFIDNGLLYDMCFWYGQYVFVIPYDIYEEPTSDVNKTLEIIVGKYLFSYDFVEKLDIEYIRTISGDNGDNTYIHTVDVYDTFNLWISKLSEVKSSLNDDEAVSAEMWSLTVNDFRECFKDAGYTETVMKDGNGDDIFYFQKENEVFSIMGQTASQQVYNDSGFVFIIHWAEADPSRSPSEWAVKEVCKAYSCGFIPEDLAKGFTEGITRGQLAEILSLFLDEVIPDAPQLYDSYFTDTSDENVLKAARCGIINGYEQDDGTYMFKPENTLKRSELAAIINRLAKLAGKTTTGFDSEVTFTDTASHWCKSELGWPVHNGIIKGTSATKFSPDNTLTVEQTITMIFRTYLAFH